MPHPHYESGEISRIGQALYEKDIRARVETHENIGKMIAIDIESGDYEIGNDPIAATDRLFARHPNAAIYGARIGYDAAYAIGGTLNRTAS